MQCLGVPAQGETALREDTGEVRTHDQAVGPIARLQDQQRVPGWNPQRRMAGPASMALVAHPVTQEHQLLHLRLAGCEDLIELILLTQQFQARRGCLVDEGNRTDGHGFRGVAIGWRDDLDRTLCLGVFLGGRAAIAEMQIPQSRRGLRTSGCEVVFELCPARGRRTYPIPIPCRSLRQLVQLRSSGRGVLPVRNHAVRWVPLG